jgi:hypothetical protein
MRSTSRSPSARTRARATAGPNVTRLIDAREDVADWPSTPLLGGAAGVAGTGGTAGGVGVTGTGSAVPVPVSAMLRVAAPPAPSSGTSSRALWSRATAGAKTTPTVHVSPAASVPGRSHEPPGTIAKSSTSSPEIRGVPSTRSPEPVLRIVAVRSEVEPTMRPPNCTGAPAKCPWAAPASLPETRKKSVRPTVPITVPPCR